MNPGRSRAALPAALLVLAGAGAGVATDYESLMPRDPIVVRNAESPHLGQLDVELTELWQVGAEDDEVIFGQVAQVIVDESGQVYVLDGQLCRIHVFSRDGVHLRTFGREGEGPGEFSRPQDLFPTPGGLLGVAQVFPGRIVQLTPKGDPAGLFPLPDPGRQKVFRGRGDADRLVVAGSMGVGPGPRPGDSTERTFLRAFGPDGQLIASYHEEEHVTRYGGMEFREPEFVGFEWRWDLAPDGRVAAATDFEKYRIEIWGPDGAPLFTIERPEFRPVERTAEEKKRFQRFYDSITTWNPGSTFHTEDIHPTVTTLQFRADGDLWVQTSAGTWRTPEGILASFDVFDAEGRFLREVHLHAPGIPGEDRVFFGGDRAFVVTQYFDTQAGDAVTGGAPEPSRLIAYEIGAVGSGDDDRPSEEAARVGTWTDPAEGSGEAEVAAEGSGEAEVAADDIGETEVTADDSGEIEVAANEVRNDGTASDAKARVLETAHLRLQWAEGVPESAVAAVAEQGESFYSSIRELLGTAPARKIPIVLQGPAEPADGSPRGYPRVDPFGRILLYEFGGEPSSYLSALAHEMVHVFRFEQRREADWFFEEGFAELIALTVDPSLRGFPWYDTPIVVAAGQWFQRGEALSLEDLQRDHRGLNLPCKAQSYTLRSAFFHHLAAVHGLPALLRMADRRPAGSLADYQDVLGTDFPALVAGWEEALLEEYGAIGNADEIARRYREDTPIQYMPECAGSGSRPSEP